MSLFPTPTRVPLDPGVVLLPGFALPHAGALLAAIDAVTARAPLRTVVTPGGKPMSVSMTNTGPLGWVTDRRGYRYEADDPLTGTPWPGMPDTLRSVAVDAARAAGFPGYDPDACLVNRYAPGARMTLHQDRDEDGVDAPIVSVSLGLPATFQLGGLTRSGPTVRVPLSHGDVLVWGGPARLRFHGVLPVPDGHHPDTGAYRFNLTFRRVRRT